MPRGLREVGSHPHITRASCEPLTHPAMPKSLTCPASHRSQNHFLGKTEWSGRRRGAAGIAQQLPMNQGLLSAGWAEAAPSARQRRDAHPGAVRVRGESKKPHRQLRSKSGGTAQPARPYPKERQTRPKIHPTQGKDASPEPFSSAVLSFPRQEKQICL